MENKKLQKEVKRVEDKKLSEEELKNTKGGGFFTINVNKGKNFLSSNEIGSGPNYSNQG